MFKLQEGLRVAASVRPVRHIFTTTNSFSVKPDPESRGVVPKPDRK